MAEISIILPVHNGEIYIQEAIDSVLRQSFTDFELLVIDDGSTDYTSEIVLRYSDPRLRLISRPHGFIDSLNDGLLQAQGKYIARMDTDDLMHPDRLHVQYHIMEEEPTIDVCASWVTIFGNGVSPRLGYSDLSGLIRHPELLLLERNIIANPTVMLRHSFILEHNVHYKKGYPHAEDYKLWVDMVQEGGTFYIEPDPLLAYRISPKQVSQRHTTEQRDSAERIRCEHLHQLMLTSPLLKELQPIYKEAERLHSLKLLSIDELIRLMCSLISNRLDVFR